VERETPDVASDAENRYSRAGIGLDSAGRMLVEGGYLHSMKRIVENAEQLPQGHVHATSTDAASTRKRPGALARSMRILKVILLGSDRQS
jgi:hypothetical protein